MEVSIDPEAENSCLITVEIICERGTFEEQFFPDAPVLEALSNAGYGGGSVLHGGEPVEGGTFADNDIADRATLSVVLSKDEAPPNMEALGFPDEHLELLSEWLGSKEDPGTWLSEAVAPTWQAHEEFWRNKVEGWEGHEAKREKSLIQWPRGWNATCTDASQPRYLKAKPGEVVRCSVGYCHKETKSTCIIQYQIGIDHFPKTSSERGDISQICSSNDVGNKTFDLKAPAEPGLYMIWGKGAYHYSFKQACEQWPGSYTNCDKWYGAFVAWLRVDPDVEPVTVGAETAARFETPPEGWV